MQQVHRSLMGKQVTDRSGWTRVHRVDKGSDCAGVIDPFIDRISSMYYL